MTFILATHISHSQGNITRGVGDTCYIDTLDYISLALAKARAGVVWLNKGVGVIWLLPFYSAEGQKKTRKDREEEAEMRQETELQSNLADALAFNEKEPSLAEAETVLQLAREVVAAR